MSRPLDLAVFPEGGCETAAHCEIKGRRCVECVDEIAKRLTDAELAAAYWMSSSRRERLLGYKDGYWSATDSAAEEEARRMNIIRRFATLPHYDEPQP